MQLPEYLERRPSDIDSPRFCLAYDRLRGVEVATKWASEKGELSALANEWQVLHRLRPGPFVRPVEFGRLDEGRAWMTTRRLDANPLADHKKLNSREMIEVAFDALAGLAALHRAGYVHGDVRPQNLLVRRGPCGFGAFWADLEHAMPFDHLAAGFSYIAGWHAPHLERGQSQTPRADLAAFGQMLRAHVPEGESTDDETTRRCLTQFARELDSDTSVSTPLDGEEAYDRLRQLCEDASIPLPATEPHIGPPFFIANRAAQQWWQGSWPRWRACTKPLFVSLVGAEGAGKTSFLRAAAALVALDGHRVVDLLPVPHRDDRETCPTPDWSRSGELGLPRSETLLVLLPLALLDGFLQQSDSWARPGTIVVVECRTNANCSFTAPSLWQTEEYTFPPLSAREWFQWVSGSF